MSHHATALNGSDIVYSTELQTGSIRKLQMLLKKIRIGLDPRSDKEPLHEITAAFDSAHRSVVRTPVFEADAPCTPMPVAELSREQQHAHTEGKVISCREMFQNNHAHAQLSSHFVFDSWDSTSQHGLAPARLG